LPGHKSAKKNTKAHDGPMAPSKADESELYRAFKDLSSGTFGGIAQVVSGHPLDTIKVRLQTQQPDPATGKMPFDGMIDWYARTPVRAR